MNGSLGQFWNQAAGRWHRSPDVSKAREGLRLLGDTDYVEAQAIATAGLIDTWARRICDLWHLRGFDGCNRLLREYRYFSERSGKQAEQRYSQVLDKLGTTATRMAKFTQGDAEENDCSDAAQELLSLIQGINDRTFLAEVPDLISRWEATAVA